MPVTNERACLTWDSYLSDKFILVGGMFSRDLYYYMTSKDTWIFETDQGPIAERANLDAEVIAGRQVPIAQSVPFQILHQIIHHKLYLITV